MKIVFVFQVSKLASLYLYIIYLSEKARKVTFSEPKLNNKKPNISDIVYGSFGFQMNCEVKSILQKVTLLIMDCTKM